MENTPELDDNLFDEDDSIPQEIIAVLNSTTRVVAWISTGIFLLIIMYGFVLLAQLVIWDDFFEGALSLLVNILTIVVLVGIPNFRARKFSAVATEAAKDPNPENFLNALISLKDFMYAVLVYLLFATAMALLLYFFVLNAE